ncbi:hypothetical protein [Dellaglioa algida]|uniref:hypothetical protein n=1 Tax=Dellaglioa algida TaxID=105612 RepID=UPI0024C485E3|nr:hypothetical protein [Dellaglioa algida]MDK1727208.1 hypothetical protein [Dellaglioa algida]
MREEFQKQNNGSNQVDGHKVLNGWLAFFLTFSLIVLFVTSVLRMTVLNQKYTEDRVLTDTSVSLVTREMNDAISNIATLNNVPASIVKDALTDQQVDDIAKASLGNIYTGKEKVINPTEITNQVASNISKKVNTSNATDNAEADSLVATFKSNLNEYLTNNVQNSYLSKISSTVSSIKSTVQSFFLYSLIVSVVLALLLLVVNRAFFIPLKYIGSSAIWSGILIAVGSALALYTGLISIVSSRAAVFTGIVSSYINDTLNTTLVGSLMMVVVGLVFWLIGRNRNK